MPDTQDAAQQNLKDIEWAQSMQRHHDLYVGLKFQKKLHPKDQPHFDEAKRRERLGLVKPYNPDATS